MIYGHVSKNVLYARPQMSHYINDLVDPGGGGLRTRLATCPPMISQVCPIWFVLCSLLPCFLFVAARKLMIQGLLGGGGGGLGGQDIESGGPPNFIKREKTLCMCVQMGRVLVVNSYPDPPPPFPKSSINP